VEFSLKDFKESANKHLKTCECLINQCYSDKKLHIKDNIFYLCGYVIEIMIKYRILKHLPQSNTKYFTKEELKKEDLLEHKIRNLLRILRSKYSENNLLFENNCMKLFYQWDVQMRYKKNFYDQKFSKGQSIQEIFNFTKEFYNAMRI